jgi:transposase
MTRSRQRFSPEFRKRAVRLVQEHRPEYRSDWGAIKSIAEKMGCSAEALRNWYRQGAIDTGKKPGVTTDAYQRLKELERENLELRRANEILRKASAFFAQAEFDRRPR